MSAKTLFFLCISLFFANEKSQVSAVNLYELYMTDYCKGGTYALDIDPSQHAWTGIIHSSRRHHYPRGLNCQLKLSAKEGYGMVLSINKLDLKRDFMGNCVDFLQIQEGNSKISNLCGSKQSHWHKFYVSDSPSEPLNIHFHAESGVFNFGYRGFEIVFTVFEKPNGSNCSPEMFKCKTSNICIPSNLMCNGLNNCGDLSDEKADSCMVVSPVAIAITLLAVIVILILLAGTAYYCVKRSRTTYTTVQGVPQQSFVPMTTYQTTQQLPASAPLQSPPPPGFTGYNIGSQYPAPPPYRN